MRDLAAGVDRYRLETYAKAMPLHAGVVTTLDDLTRSENVDAKLALSTTGFAGLMALVNKFHHTFSLAVAASPALGHLLSQHEKSCLIRSITDEEEKVRVLDDLTSLHEPDKHLLFHIGDSMGDFLVIRHVAAVGGIGIAFNPNKPLKVSIAGESRNIRTRICELDFPPGENPNYTRVGDVIREELWKVLRVQL
jgi:phosphoserine phosphatase